MPSDTINALDYAIRIKVYIYEGTACYIKNRKNNNVCKVNSTMAGILPMKHNLVMELLLMMCHRYIK